MSIPLPDSNSSLEDLKAFSNVEFIVTDLDGTLVQGPNILGQFCRLQQKLGGLTITIATGRTYAGAKLIAEQMGIKKGTPILLYNGAVVLAYKENRVLYRRTIPNSVLKDLCNLIDFKRQYLMAYYLVAGQEDIIETVHGFGTGATARDVNGMEINWHQHLDMNESEIVSTKGTPLQVSDVFRNLGGIPLFQREFEPCSILIDRRVIGNRSVQVEQYLEQCPLISYTSSGYGFLEITGKAVNKGIIFQYINTGDKRKCIAVGDNDNDVHLLKNADIGVVVSNGSLAAKQVATYLCKNKGAAGVLELLHTIREARRYFKEV